MKTSGTSGRTNVLVRNTVKSDGSPNTTTFSKSTLRCAPDLMAPMAAVIPTANSEYVVASTGSTPITYTRIGTVSIVPPLPIRPNVVPTTTASTNPKII